MIGKCNRGHLRTEENTYYNVKSKIRHCRVCSRAAERQRSLKNRESATHCRNGHEYTDANTTHKVNSRGNLHRSCRECERRRSAVYLSSQNRPEHFRTVAAKQERRIARFDVVATPIGDYQGQSCPREFCTGTLFTNQDNDLQCISCERAATAVLVEPKKVK